MEKIAATGRAFFAVCIMALGVENVVCAHVREDVLPVLPWLPPRPGLAYVTGLILIATGLAIAVGFQARAASIVLACYLLVCDVLLQLPWAAASPFDLSLRTTLFEVLSLCGAAMMLAATLRDLRTFPVGLSALDKILETGRQLFAFSSVIFGISHFLIARYIATLIPAWIPGRLFWAYFTGGAFLAVGVSIAVGRLARTAAFLLGSMFLLWFLLLHMPRVLSLEHVGNPNEWSSAFIALGMCGASWIIAGARPFVGKKSNVFPRES